MPLVTITYRPNSMLAYFSDRLAEILQHRHATTEYN